MNPEPLHIACAINANYVVPMAVMLESLKRSIRADCQPVVHLLHAGLPEATIAALSRILELRPIHISESQMEMAPSGSRFPREAAFPLLLAQVLAPEIDRILFLDADLLVLDDPAKLWKINLDGAVLGAVGDVAVPLCSAPRGVKHWQNLGIPAEAPYFNSGVMLIDLKQWRSANVTAHALRYLEQTSERIDFPHQEALNAVIWDRWKSLDQRWNLIASRAGRNFDPSGSAAWKDPGIVHFAGHMKPWRASIGGPFQAPYQKVLRHVSASFPLSAVTAREQCASFYDVYLRDTLFPLEQWCWKRRLF